MFFYVLNFNPPFLFSSFLKLCCSKHQNQILHDVEHNVGGLLYFAMKIRKCVNASIWIGFTCPLLKIRVKFFVITCTYASKASNAFLGELLGRSYLQMEKRGHFQEIYCHVVFSVCGSGNG